MNVGELADELISQCVTVTERVFAAHAPDGRLPRVFAGHLVGADVRADVLFTLTHLGAAGVIEIGDAPIDDLITALLRDIDGEATHSFFSYRVAETLLDAGAFAGNARLAGLSDAQRGEVARACDSSSFLPLLDQGKLPRNYIAVLARCEQARLRLGLIDDRARVDDLVARLRTVLAANPRHCLDDSHDGAGRYDIYTPDVWLFCEPLAEAIGSEWRAGLADALALVERTVGSDGTAIPWGRSTGVLSIALTVELGAAALAHGVGDAPERWLRRSADATASMEGWFGADGVVNAHQHRDQDAYRGPARRLQLTFDLLGKLAWAARTLRALADGSAGTTHDGRALDSITAARRADAYPALDELVRFDDTTTARVWTYRSPALAWSLPFVGPARSHYLPAPVRPGLFEVPVDRDLPCWAPLAIAGHERFVGGGLPASVEHAAGRVTAHYSGFVPTTDTFAATGGRRAPGLGAIRDAAKRLAAGRAPRLDGTRTASWRVEGRTLVLDDALHFAEAPQALAISIPETGTRPLLVDFECDAPHVAAAIDVDGIAEWRSSWSQITRVHQLDIDPARAVRYTARVTPKLRIASSAHGHHYERSLFGPLADRVVTGPGFDDVDVFHLHWPEWVEFGDLDTHRALVRSLAARGIPTVWTAHNLTPHLKLPERFDPLYALWAEHAAAVIHHSEWGRAQMLARYEFGAQVEHVVIPHGHFGGLWSDELKATDRAAAEARLGLSPCALRIGIVGAPRAEKLTEDFAAGFAASRRDDVQLCVWALSKWDDLPDDPRITIAERYRNVDMATYATRLAACDLLALPFDPSGEMLATGTAADAIGVGLPVLATDWGFLTEYFGAACFSIGDGSPGAVTAAIDALDAAMLPEARSAVVALRPRFEWEPIAEATHAVFDRVVTRGVSD